MTLYRRWPRREDIVNCTGAPCGTRRLVAVPYMPLTLWRHRHANPPIRLICGAAALWRETLIKQSIDWPTKGIRDCAIATTFHAAYCKIILHFHMPYVLPARGSARIEPQRRACCACLRRCRNNGGALSLTTYHSHQILWRVPSEVS